ncbi:MAG: nucleotidyltransferase domain-containing protein [bacterium]|nr:nucleotidyltransferase domain-containing protein [bacterium]
MKEKEKWELALEQFVSKRKKKKELTGMIVCGSYITGNPTKHSDIDIHIILDKSCKRREKGNEIIDGFLFEYFANPIRKNYEYLQKDFQQRLMMDAHMFATGRVVFDKTGELTQIIKDAQDYLGKEYPKPNEDWVELAKYSLWDMLDNLEEVREANEEDFHLVFYTFSKKLFDIYAKFLQFDFLVVNKLQRFLSNPQDQKKYQIKKFPDQNFVKNYLKMIKIKNSSQMMEEYKSLTNYLLDKMGGFNIDGWKIRSTVD